MIGPSPNRNPSPYSDGFEDQPPEGPFFKWGLGVLVPIIIVAFGLHAVVTRQAIYGGQSPIVLRDINAIAFGVAALSLAVFLHCHYFWGNLYNQAWYAVLGKILSAASFIGGLGVLIVRLGVLGIR